MKRGLVVAALMLALSGCYKSHGTLLQPGPGKSCFTVSLNRAYDAYDTRTFCGKDAERVSGWLKADRGR